MEAFENLEVGPVAQLDRALRFERRGWEFEPLRVHHGFPVCNLVNPPALPDSPQTVHSVDKIVAIIYLTD
jgi:hypothetical protein